MRAEDIAKRIDHTNLKLDAKKEDIERLCEEAEYYKFKAVCVRPEWVKYAYEQLVELHADKRIGLAAVVGFPKKKFSKAEDMEKYSIEEKAEEAKRCVIDRANEIDLVINVGKLKKENNKYILNEIYRVVQKSKGADLVKVIVESVYLDRLQIRKACKLIKKAGAHCIKTSTGYAEKKEKVKEKARKVKMMKECGGGLLVKASGGIRDYKKVMEMIKAGADIIGTSSGINIYKEALKAYKLDRKGGFRF